jgi:hypothetical protein
MPKYKKKPSLSKRPGSFGKAFGKSTLSIAKGLLQMLNLLKVFPFQRTPLQTRTLPQKKPSQKDQEDSAKPLVKIPSQSRKGHHKY